jgi:DNA-binding MarR family transcriptional regulator
MFRDFLQILVDSILISIYSLTMPKGPIDVIKAQWREERPDLDTSSIGVSDRIDRLAKIIQGEAKKVLESLGTSPWEYEVLVALRRSGPDYELLPRELADALLVSSGALTNRLDHLEKARLIERRPNQSDRRSLRIRLTKKGAARADALVEVSLRRKRELFDALGPAERETLEKILQKLLIALEPLATG